MNPEKYFTTYKRFECDFCGFTTEWLDAIEEHLITVHGKEIQE